MSIVNQQVNIGFKTDVSPLARVVSHVSRMERGLYKLNRGLDSNSRSLSRNQRSMKKFSDQGLANIQAGLVQLSTYMMLFNQRLDNMFDKATNRFAGVDEALTQLRITMGLTGDRSLQTLESMGVEDNVLNEYNEVTERMAELARSTQFTNKELVNLSDEFKRTGKSGRETMVLTDLARQLSAASAGAIDLATAGTMVNNSIYAFGGTVDTVPLTLDRMLKASQTLNMGLTDVTEAFKSLSGAMSNLDNSKGDADAFFLTMLAGYKSLGKSPREAAQALKQSMQSVLKVYSRVDKQFLRSIDNITSADSLRKIYTSRTLRHEGRTALLAMLGLRGANKDVQEEARKIAARLNSTVTKEITEAAKDKIAKRLLTGVGGKMTPREFIKFLESSNKNLRALGSNETEVAARLNKAFGTQAIPTMMKAFKLVAKDADSFNKKMNGIIDSYGRLQTAADESMKSLANRLKLAESAEDALTIAIMREDVVAKGALETYTSLVSATTDFMDANPKVAQSVAALGRALQYASGILTQVGFALVAMATFSIGANYAFKGTSMATLSLGRIMGGFYSVFLAPTLAILLKIVAATTLVSLGFVGFIKYVTDAKTVSGGMVKIFESLNEKIKVFSGFMGLYNNRMKMSTEQLNNQVAESSKVARLEEKRLKTALQLKKVGPQGDGAEGLRAKLGKLDSEIAAIETKRQNFLKAFGVDSMIALERMDTSSRKSIMGLSEDLVSLIKIFSSFAKGVMEPLGAAIGTAFATIGPVLKAVLSPLIFIGKMFGFVGEKGSGVAEILGFLVGSFFSFKILMTSTFGALKFLRGGLTSVVERLLRYRDGLIMLSEQKAKNNELERLTSYRFSQTDVTARKVAAAYHLLTGRVAGAVAQYHRLNQELETNFLLTQRGQAGSVVPFVARRSTTQTVPTLGGVQRTVVAGVPLHPDLAGARAAAANTAASSIGQVGDAAQKAQQGVGRLGNSLNKVGGFLMTASFAGMVLNETLGGQNEMVGSLLTGLMSLSVILPMLTSIVTFFKLGIVGMAAAIWSVAWPLLLLAGAGAALYYLFKPKSASAAPPGGNTLSPSKADTATASTSPMGTPSAVKPASMTVPRTASMPSAVASAVEPTSSISAREVNIHITQKVRDGEDFARMVKKVIKDDRVQIIK